MSRSLCLSLLSVVIDSQRKSDIVRSVPICEEFFMKLVYLVFAVNSCYCKVVDEPPEGVVIDVEKRTWRYKHAIHKQDEPIGHARHLGHHRSGVIGVYDSDDTTQLSAMVHSALGSQRDHLHAD